MIFQVLPKLSIITFAVIQVILKTQKKLKYS